ncbi:cytochrome P450 [Lichenicola cladoniae]|uniref:Bifunctional cytochrome P450/NADPH--P450 reductase n=1 Tax=Lichenicola cladoniae TaxID=1484109 RepID=A0A6M8HLN3_9PROT|nr:cytochrome P450 [Lichenicola cladoniae]NPD70207.1 cytochrome P450 [Acetobacteraceae bacterium]QKE89245.1 cytochrome P450 [Lichenicola cladoniae]
MPISPIPQPRTIPLLGNLADIDSHGPVQSLMRLAAEHGEIFRLSLAGQNPIIVSSHALVDELCDETRFCKKVHSSIEHVRPLAGDGLFTAYDHEPNWARAHHLLMPAFGPLGVRAMFGKMLDVAEQMLLRWERFGDAEIDVADNMTRLTLDTIALCAFDYRFNSFYQNEMHPFVAAMVGALDEASARARRPEVASLVMLTRRRQFDHDVRLMHALTDTLVAERRAHRRPDGAPDLLDIMLDGQNDNGALPDENIRYQMVTFLVAGHETTSGLLSFALFLALQNPTVLDQARAQIDAVLEGRAPTVEDLGRLHCVEQILMETLRLWPTAPAFAVTPLQDTIVGGRYAVTTEDTLLVLSPALHRDPAVWGADAERFRPDRFAPEQARQLPPNAWKPFGTGRRACIGRGFAMQEAQLVLAMILQRFHIELADPGYRLEITETLTIKPHNLFIRARRRGPAARRPASAMPSAPQRPLTPHIEPAAAGPSTGGRLLVLYGSNTGSCEAFARRIASDAAGQGYAAKVAGLDTYTGQLPTDGAVILLSATYEGQPPDNAAAFLSWLEAEEPGALSGVRFAVFGCGNPQWSRTYQAIPKRLDGALERAGANRIRPRGEADASGDFFGDFDEWYAQLWADLGRTFGQQPVAAAVPQALEMDVLPPGRATSLRLTDLQGGVVLSNRILGDTDRSPGNSVKRHIEIALPSGMSYRTGDYLAVLPRNPPNNVTRALRRFALAPDTQIVVRKGGPATTLPVGYPVSVAELLANYVELEQPATREHVNMLVECTHCTPEKMALAAFAHPDIYRSEVLAKRVSLLSLLERFPSCNLSLAAFLGSLPGMRVRQYSISSSPLRDPARCSLTFSVLDAPALSGNGQYLGVASNYLAGLGEGARPSVAVRPSQAFHPPAEPATPMILVCAGAGFAPFHGFLQERALLKRQDKPVGPALLFFGVAHRDIDRIYREELRTWEDEGVVTVRMSYSREPEGDVRYVQHRMWQDRADVADLFRRGATVFVCGDGVRMAPDVRATFVRIYGEAMTVPPEEAEAWADRIEHENGRYVADVFS